MASSFTLPVRTRLSAAVSSPRTQIRHASGPSTPRRARKALNIPPAPHAGGSLVSAGGTSGRSHQPHQPESQPSSNPLKVLSGSSGTLGSFRSGDRIVYAPPSSAPNVFHTPPKFLPIHDPRRSALARLEAQKHKYARAANPTAGLGGEKLPPPTRQPYTKITAASVAANPGAHHLSATAIAEMRALRQSDENTWTRSKLAEKFGCSQLFVALVVQASKDRIRSLEKQTDAVRSRWGRKRRVARMERGMRREMWGRDE